MIAWAIVFLSVRVCGSPGRRLLKIGASDLPKPALSQGVRQILTAIVGRASRPHYLGTNDSAYKQLAEMGAK